ncbi:MAG: hypothetical protein OEV92_10770 [Nitrospinota bacterium]|nr:hypothetical protein [Nitrospinota bacterium]
MLIVISDLHFTDGTTSNMSADGKDLFNVSAGAFKLFFEDLAETIKRTNAKRKGIINEVTLVYNGDIFDPLRTTAWFNHAADERPWHLPFSADVQNAVYGHCRKILVDICGQNEEALGWLNGTAEGIKESWPDGVAIKRVYIPGNHDRILNQDQQCRQMIHQKLLNQSDTQVFRNYWEDPDHSTLVLHGHEADPFNCEYLSQGSPDYNRIPIGDAMTTMLFARIGYMAENQKLAKEAVWRLKEIDNVRPALSGIRFVQDIITDFGIEGAMNAILRHIVADFRNLPFYNDWIKRHDKWSSFWDEADKCQFALEFIERLGSKLPAGMIEKIAGLTGQDNAMETHAKDQLENYDRTHADMRYCVFGHTHTPLHAPLYVSNGAEKHYLNSGTFRTAFTQTLDRRSFLKHKRLSYVVVYRPGEFQGNDYPAYEMWSGIRMND